MLVDREQVGHDLAGVLKVGECVNHWHAGMLRQSLQKLVVGYPGHDAVHVTGEHLGNV